jgi:16S rRNA processing protein RimM
LRIVDLKDEKVINQKSKVKNPKRSPLTIGRVRGIHGLKGTLKVESFAESPDTFKSGRKVSLKSHGIDGVQHSVYSIRKVSAHKRGILLDIEGIESCSLAEDLVGQEILMDRAELPELEEDTWYWQDIIGLEVVDHIRGYIGKISKILPTGANDVLVVRDKKKEILVPMHKNFLESVDMEKGKILTTLPDEWIVAENKVTKTESGFMQKPALY